MVSREYNAPMLMVWFDRAMRRTNPGVPTWHYNFRGSRGTTARDRENMRLGTAGEYTRDNALIKLYSINCATPGSRSWPGIHSDRTLVGVYVHEVGHHFSAVRGRDELSLVRGLVDTGDPRVSGYEPNAHEAWAETFRMYMINPALLRVGRSRRFEYMREAGVRSPRSSGGDWRRWAAPGMSARFEGWVDKWIARGQR